MMSLFLMYMNELLQNEVVPHGGKMRPKIEESISFILDGKKVVKNVMLYRIITYNKIKEMPEYDPNAELVSLSFTIPSWIESLDRVLSLSKYKTATKDVKNKVKKELHNLEFSIGTMLLALEE